MSGQPDFYTMVARGKLGASDAWQWHTLEALDRRPGSRCGDTMVTGAIPVGTITRGPRKGCPKWGLRRDDQRVVVTESELNAARARYESIEGKCWHCGGTGQEVARISVADGTEYRPCYRCSGSGNPPNPSTPESSRA